MVRLFIFFFLLQTLPVSGATNEEILAVMAGQTIEQHIRPGYLQLQQQSSSLHQKMQTLCQAPSQANLKQAQDQFSKTVLAFAFIEHVHFGPMVDSYRRERFSYWPDRKGRGARAVRKILRLEDQSVLSADSLAKKSVAVQGLTALELVLYKSSDSLLGTANSFHCRYGQAIAQNLVIIADQVVAGWGPKADIVQQMLAPKPDNGRYRNRKEVVQEIYQAIVSGFKTLHDVRLKPVLGKTIETPKPKRAAFWRSDLAIDVMQHHLEGLKHLVSVSGFQNMLPANSVDLQKHVTKIYEEIGREFQKFEQKKLSIADVVSTENPRNNYEKIAARIMHLNAGFARNFAVAADLPLGFNATDGD